MNAEVNEIKKPPEWTQGVGFILFLGILIAYFFASLQEDFWPAAKIGLVGFLLWNGNIMLQVVFVAIPLKSRSQLSKNRTLFLWSIAFSCIGFFAWHLFFERHYGNGNSIMLGFLAAAIIVASFSLIKKIINKSNRIMRLKTLLLILLFSYAFLISIYHIDAKLLEKKDYFPTLPYMATIVLILWRQLIKNIIGLCIFRRLSAKTKAKVTELSLWNLFGIAYSIVLFLSNFKAVLFVLVLFVFFVLSLPGIRHALSNFFEKSEIKAIKSDL